MNGKELSDFRDKLYDRSKTVHQFASTVTLDGTVYRPKTKSKRFWRMREINPAKKAVSAEAAMQSVFDSNFSADVDPDAVHWLNDRDRIFKTNAGYVFAEYLEVAADEILDNYYAKFNRHPRNILPFKSEPGPGFTLTVKSTAITTETVAAEIERQQKLVDGSLLNVTRMSAFAKRKIEWLWPNRIPAGAMSTIAGEPDVGKSLLTLYMAACITRGLPFYGSDVPSPMGEVLILAAEDDPENTLLPRLEAAGADPNGVHLLRSVMTIDGKGKNIGERAAQLDKDVTAICAVLDKNPYIRLVIVDPISSYLGNKNINRDQEVREVLMPLVSKAQASGVVVLLVAHFNKNSETRVALDKVGGTKALVAIGRSAWTCVREPKDEGDAEVPEVPEGQIDQGERYMFLKLKGNLAPSKIGGLFYTIRTRDVEVSDRSGNKVMMETPFIQFLEETKSTAQDVVIDGKVKPREKTKVEVAAEWLKETLDEMGVAWSVDVVALGKENGFTYKALQRALGTLRGYKAVRANKQTQWLAPGRKADESLPRLTTDKGKRNTVKLDKEAD